jgi:hypothetical protein
MITTSDAVSGIMSECKTDKKINYDLAVEVAAVESTVASL